MVIKFGPTLEDARTWAQTFDVFQYGERTLSGFAELRAALRIFDALEAVSEEVRGKDAAGDPAIVGRRLVEGGAEVTLRDDDAALLRRVVRDVLVENRGGRRPLTAHETARVLKVLEIPIPEE